MTRDEYAAAVTEEATALLERLPKNVLDSILVSACIEAATEIAIRANKTGMVGAKFIETGFILMEYGAAHAQAH